MFQVVRTVLQEERRDPGVPTPKARQVFLYVCGIKALCLITFSTILENIFILLSINEGCERFGYSRGTKVTLQVLFENLVDIGSNQEG